jgi:glutathione synthase/RimK-type ligase-like ATP-grasp enzyme
MKTAILFDEKDKMHSTNWSKPWIDFCIKNDLEYNVIDPFQNDVTTQLVDYDIILWHFSNYSYKDMLIAKNVLFTMEKLGKKVFPSIDDAWHFDDKLAETYLLQAIKAPIPDSFYFYSKEDVIKSAKKLHFPLIAKLRNGSGSHNVTMLKSEQELMNYSHKMFSTGISSAPSLLYKASGNIKSAKSLKVFVNRAKRIPEFLRSLANAKKFNYERDYVYLQEFIPNDGYDLKIVVVGDKLSFIGRNIREGEFRASGGGDIFYDKEKVTKNVIDSAFETSDKLGFLCMGYDYVVNNNTGEGIIIEISYGFSHEALLLAGGYFDRKGNWHLEPLNAPFEVLKNMTEK